MHLICLDQIVEQTDTTLVSKILDDNMTIHSQINCFKKVMRKASFNNYIAAI